MNLACAGSAGVENWQVNSDLHQLEQDEFVITDSRDYAYLQVCQPISDLSEIRKQAEYLYRKALQLTQTIEKSRLVRIWNYIPQINAGEGDEECYRQFCWGRADALGNTSLPAATGIGSRDGVLRIGILCTHPDSTPAHLQIRHQENPRQLSAYNYPRAYGPRSPSFARATLISTRRDTQVQPGNPSALLLLSGTASIVNHQSRHPGDLSKQSEETAANIQMLLSTLGSPATPLGLRYYLRDEKQLSEAIDGWHKHFADWPLPSFLLGDICRSELEMEVEGVFSV